MTQVDLLNGWPIPTDNDKVTTPPPLDPSDARSSSGQDAQLRRVLDAAEVALATLDADGHVVAANQSFAKVCDVGTDTLLGAHLVGLYPPDAQADILAAFVRVVGAVSSIERLDVRLPSSSGRSRSIRLTFGPMSDKGARVHQVTVVAVDLTSQVHAERRRRRDVLEVTRSATTEASTGLRNRVGLDGLLASATRRSGRTAMPFSVLQCELTGLGDAIRSLDEATASSVLEIYSTRMSKRLRPSDEVCRVDDDGFTVIAEDLGDVQDAAGVAYRLLSSVVEPVVVDDVRFSLPMTIGIVVADGSASPGQLVEVASAALAEARTDGGGGFRIIDVRTGLAA